MNNTSCFNCGAKAKDGVWLSPISIDGSVPGPVVACDDCHAEAARIEDLACELSDRPSCEERQRIVAQTDSIALVVNRLTAHDQSGCAECAAIRLQKPCDDCGQLVAAHLLLHNEIFHLDLCAACNARQLRHDAIVERHNADVRRVA